MYVLTKYIFYFLNNIRESARDRQLCRVNPAIATSKNKLSFRGLVEGHCPVPLFGNLDPCPDQPVLRGCPIPRDI